MKIQLICRVCQSTVVAILLIGVTRSFGQPGNLVQASISHQFDYSTDADQISDLPVLSSEGWLAELRNLPDATGASVFSPSIDVTTSQNFVQFGPTNPIVTSIGPGLTSYFWDFPSLEVKQPQILDVVGRSTVAPVSVQPRISITRSVTPEVLTQTV